MTTTIRTSDKIYTNGSMSSHFPNINNWFTSFQVYIYFNDVLTRLRLFAFFFYADKWDANEVNISKLPSALLPVAHD